MDFSRNTCLSLSFITLSFSFLFSSRLIALPKVNNYKLNSEFIDSVVQNIKNTQKELDQTSEKEELPPKISKYELTKTQTAPRIKKQKKVIISHGKSLKNKSKTKVKVSKSLKIISQEQNTIFLNPKAISEPIQIKIDDEFPILRKPSQI